MVRLRFWCICFTLIATAFSTIDGFGQEESTKDKPSSSTLDKLVQIAVSRVEQHEIRLKAVRTLGKLKGDIHEVQLQQAKTQMDSVQAELNAAEVLSEQQRRELARTKQLVEKAVVTHSKLADAESQVANAVARLAHARNNLKRAETNIHATSLQLEQSRWESALKEAEVTIELLDAKAELIRLQGSHER